jgi:diaminopropionate ammonia-lyase
MLSFLIDKHQALIDMTPASIDTRPARRGFVNTAVIRDAHFRGLFSGEEHREVRDYFGAHPELPPTPLRRLTTVASALGIGAVDAKDETGRYGVNAFKIAGVRYAVHRIGDDAAARGLVCATAGNHGRAVARVARQKRIPCTVFVPRAATNDPIELATRASRIAAMEEDGATVVHVDGSYEEAVRRAAVYGQETGGTIVSDTSWDGYEEIPRWIMAGYTQVFEEAFSQWDSRPALVVVQGGVGGLVCAAASWLAWRFGADRPLLVAAEPDSAACLLESAAAGRAVTIRGPLTTIMAGLRCAEPSPAAWPTIASGVDAFVSVPDSEVLDAMAMLKDGPEEERIEAGPSGACGMAALAALVRAPELAEVRAGLALDWGAARCMVIVTEGV